MIINFLRKNKKPKKKRNKKIYIDNIPKRIFKKRKKKHILGLIRKININFKSKNLYFYYLIAFIIFISLITFVILWPFFRITKINIYRNDSITNINIAYRATENIRWKSILFINKKEISNLIKNYQWNIKNIKISLDLPNTLNINIWSFKEVFNTKNNSKNYIVVQNWTFIPLKKNKNLINVNIIVKNKTNIIPDYKKVIKQRIVLKIEELYKRLKDNLITIKIKNVYLYLIEKNLVIELNNWNKLIFSLVWNIKSQVENLMILNKEHFNINKRKLVYIDLRIKNKIFFCGLEEEYQCRKNFKRIYPYNSQ